MLKSSKAVGYFETDSNHSKVNCGSYAGGVDNGKRGADFNYR